MSRPYRINYSKYIDEDLIYKESNYNAYRIIIYKLINRKANSNRYSARLIQINIV